MNFESSLKWLSMSKWVLVCTSEETGARRNLALRLLAGYAAAVPGMGAACGWRWILGDGPGPPIGHDWQEHRMHPWVCL